MNDPGKNKKIALVATAVFHIAVLLILVLSYLHYTDIPIEDDAVQQDITFFGGEYVMLGNALPQQGDEAATSAADEEQANTGDNIDDAGMAEHLGINVYMVEGDYKNIKITTANDIYIANAYLQDL